MDNWGVVKLTPVVDGWKCKRCGRIETGTPPEECPTCVAKEKRAFIERYGDIILRYVRDNLEVGREGRLERRREEW